MTEVKNLIWDLDGTLLDSYGVIVAGLTEVAGKCKVSDPPDDILLAVKRESVSAYLRALAERTGAAYPELYRQYRLCSEQHLSEITLIPGAAETLLGLQAAGAEHFVYTHRGRSTAPLLDRLGLTGFFTEVVTFENGFRPKPSGDGVRYLLDRYRLTKAATAYVGDRALDVACAKDAGVQAILYLPEGSCVVPCGAEDRIIPRLQDLLL